MEPALIHNQQCEVVKTLDKAALALPEIRKQGKRCSWHCVLAYTAAQREQKTKSKVFFQGFAHWQGGGKPGGRGSTNLSWTAQCKGVLSVTCTEAQTGNEMGVFCSLSSTLFSFIFFAPRNCKKNFFLPNSLLLSY